MARKKKRGEISAKVFATILSVTLGFSTLSFSAPGAVAFAEEAEEVLVSTEAVDAVEDPETTDSEDAATTAAEDAATTAAEADMAEEVSEDTETVETEAPEETEEVVSEEEKEEKTEEKKDDNKASESKEESSLMGEGSNGGKHDSLVDFSKETATAEGIKTTTSVWNFATDKNTGVTTAAGDSFHGIIVGGGNGRVILDKGADLNVKKNSTAETTGVIYLPIAEDTNVVTITINPMDPDQTRYVNVGSFDSTVKLVDDKNDAEHQSVTFKSDLEKYVVKKAGDVEGRFIALFSQGNFKTASIKLVETDAVTIVDVSGKLTGEGVDKVTGLKFKNETTEEITTCEVANGEYKVSLPNEFKYVVSVAGTFEYGIDAKDEGNILDLSTGNDKTKTRDFTLVAQDCVNISGAVKINKIDNAKEVSAETLKVTLVPVKTTLDKVELTLKKGVDDYNYTYTGVVLPGEEYTVELTNANDYECTEKIKADADEEKAIVVDAKTLYKVSLEPVTHNLKSVDSVTALTVKNLDDNYEYSFKNLSGKTLDINVRDGVYEVTKITTSGNYEPFEHFEVDGKTVSEKMYLKDTSEKGAVEYASEVTVGAEGCNYTTIYDALDAVKRMNRSEGQRVTVLFADAYYQEQVVVDVPDVTFKSAREDGTTISWYYGLGGDAYYSAYLNTEIDKNHLFYDEAHAVDQYESSTVGQTPGNWGSTVNLKSTATGFRAENITFENSFNYYISDAEKADIAESGAALDRKAAGADPKTYKAKERACTMYNRGANNIEFYNCSFISGQDTIYTGDADEYSYFYNCLIEGTTDFICGDGNALFDNCDLVLYGFSDQVKTDLVIVASKGSATKGYLFNYCTISADGREGIKTSTSAYLGRPWGTNDEKVAFMNTILDGNLIQEKGWTKMNNLPSNNKGLHEYNTRLVDGTKVDLSVRVADKIGTDAQGTAENYALNSDEGYTRSDYLSESWTPSYYGADYSAVNEQVLRYNALVADAEKYATVDADKKAALEKAIQAVTRGLLVSDQKTVDDFAADLEKELDDVLGKQALAPISSVKSGTYNESFEVTLNTETDGAKIYYTIDGTEPTAESILYDKAIEITKSTIVKAVAIAEGLSNSEVSVFEYVIEKSSEVTGGTYVFESKDLTAFAAETKADGATQKAGTEDYFTLIYSVKSKVDSSGKTFEDEYTSPQRLNFGGMASTEKNAVKFTTSNSATVKVWWVEGGDDNRQMAILDASGTILTQTEGTWTKNSPYISTLKVGAAGTYYLGGATNNNNIYKIVVTEDAVAEPVTYTIESSAITAFAAGAKADGATEKAGTDEYFTLIYSSKSKVDTSGKTFEDEYTSPQRINFGGVASTEKNAIKFTTSGAASVKIWWVEGGDDNRQMAILDASGTILTQTEGTWTKNSPYISTLKVDAAGTYYLGGATNNNNIYKVEVTEGSAPVVVERKDWDLVEPPVVKSVALNATDPGKIDVTVSALVGRDGGDKITAYMLRGEREILATLPSTAEKEEFVFSFVPSASGEYFFAASLSRDDADYTLESSETDKFAFTLPLAKPEFKNAVNVGKGSVKVNFYSVPEATSYQLSAIDKTDDTKKPVVANIQKPVVDNNKTEYTYTFTKLTAGHAYELTLCAIRGDEVSSLNTLDINVTKDAETEWVFSAFGTGVTSGSNCGYTKNEDGSVTVWNTGNKGKLVPASTDGLSFYYTAVPANKNFTFTAKAKIDTWTFTNGQEGFGVMAADRVGVNGDSSVFWNNSYMATATKVEYYYDKETHEVTNVDTADKITMKLGLGSQEKSGVTPYNLALLEANDSATVKSDFSSKMTPLETSCGDSGVGTYNLFGNATAAVPGTIQNPLTEITLRVQKNNTGYFVSYLDNDGNVLSTKKYYDTKALQKLDTKYVYVGVYAARSFKTTFSDMTLTLIDPSKDAKAESKPIETVEPNYKVVSATYSNTEKYELQYTGNADGILTITDARGYAIVNAKSVKSGAVEKVAVRLTKGDNKFTVTFAPNKSFRPNGDAYKRLSNYDPVTFEHSVKYATINATADKIYVTPDGSKDGDGTAEKPVDIYTAVKYVQPGQTILLAAGDYKLSETVIVERGIDGTASKPISLVSENGRAKFDFQSKCAGFIFVGDYWNIKGIDCTKSGNSEKGIQVSGSHITLEDVRTYENGNTGIQISRYLGSDKRADWPSYVLVLNCTSYSNADAGYEDADGFAAKLTCGDGIVFDGCISYNNADDGWDLFAKVESGSIGQVTIQNCVAFNNGYGVDGTNEGNGNGFKMGGESMPGSHKLINSVAWGNKAKGIDSNSCPDNQIYHSMSFNNGANNVALYTNDAANTNYIVEGVLSYRTDKGGNENFKLRGTQDESRVYGEKNFYWMDGESSNLLGLKPADDWFESLDAPKANKDDPYAVAAAMRSADGRINLGDFMKLTEKAVNALAAAGINASDVAASLGGSYDAVADERAIDGSDNDAYQSIEGFTVENFETQLAYTGNKLTQDMDVYYGTDLLKEGVDYTVAYKNNVNVGTAVVTITGKGNYSGKTIETFVIAPEDINKAAVTVKAVNETGNEAKGKYPTVTATVTYMGKALTAKKDYTLAVDWTSPAEKDGYKEYPVTITAVGDTAKRLANFSGVNASAKVKVYPKGKKPVTDSNLVSLKSGSVEIEKTTYDFTGSKIEPAVTVYTGKGTKKGEPVDASKYTVKYTANINKGTATITVSGIEAEGYTGTLTKKFTIAAVEMNKAEIAMDATVEYTKGGAKPVPVVTFKLENGNYVKLREGVDYKLTYANNNKVGVTGKSEPKVTITGLRNFKSTVVKSFAITAKDVAKTTVVTTDKAVKKNAKGTYLISKPVVYDQNGKKLVEKTDYTLKFFYGENEIDSKTALVEGNSTVKVVVTGTKAYTGETTATYQVRELKKLSSVYNDKIADQKYTGKEVRPDGSIKLYTQTGSGKTLTKTYLIKDADYEVVLCYNNVKQGTATYLLKGKGNYSGYKTVSFKIKKATTK